MHEGCAELLGLNAGDGAAAGGGERGGDDGGAGDAGTSRPAGGRRDLRAVGAGATRVSAALRVLPLGGLGEIGKNMTVVEYDGRIVVVDVGLRFPTPEMVGIDSVLPDFSYLRERASEIEAIVVTHGQARTTWGCSRGKRASWCGTIRRRCTGAIDGRDGALEARGAQAARHRAGRRGAGGNSGSGAVLDGDGAHDALDPGPERGGAGNGSGDGADHGRLQVRPDAGG